MITQQEMQASLHLPRPKKMNHENTLKIVSNYLIELGSYLDSSMHAGDPLVGHDYVCLNKQDESSQQDLDHAYYLTQATWLKIHKDKTNKNFAEEIQKFRETHTEWDSRIMNPADDLEESQQGYKIIRS
jgi:hypothetical protein